MWTFLFRLGCGSSYASPSIESQHQILWKERLELLWRVERLMLWNIRMLRKPWKNYTKSIESVLYLMSPHMMLLWKYSAKSNSITTLTILSLLHLQGYGSLILGSSSM